LVHSATISGKRKKENYAQALRGENAKLLETVEILKKNIETLKESNKRLTDNVNECQTNNLATAAKQT
jgi:FtsZ-binding cell division protein ZapB